MCRAVGDLEIKSLEYCKIVSLENGPDTYHEI